MYKETRIAGVEKWYHMPPEDANMRIPNELTYCVVFICAQITGGEHTGNYQSFGTGFIVTLLQDDETFGYLVTAKHLLDDASRLGYKKLYARMNTQDQKVEYVDLGLIKDWRTSENEAVDVALTPFLPDFKKFMFSSLSNTMLVTPTTIQLRNIGQGDELYVTGLLTLRRGRARNIPILRTGIISAMPVEPLRDTKSGELYNAFLAELRSIGGLSGSPVFVYIDKRRAYNPQIEEDKDYILYLLGMIRGHWDLKKEFEDDSEFIEDVPLGFNKGENLNVGIAVITPAYDILELLFSPELHKEREAIVKKKWSEEKQITEDSALTESSENDFTSNDFQDALKQVSRKISLPEKETKETSE